MDEYFVFRGSKQPPIKRPDFHHWDFEEGINTKQVDAFGYFTMCSSLLLPPSPPARVQIKIPEHNRTVRPLMKFIANIFSLGWYGLKSSNEQR